MTTKMGRPLLLNPERQQAICDAVRNGASASEAAAAGLVAKSTVLGWADRGRQERQRLAASPHAQPLESEAIYLDFLTELEKAADEWVIAGLAAIRAAGEGEEHEETTVVEKVGGWDGKSRHEDGSPVLYPVEQTVTVKKGRKKSWQAWAWLLERRRPDEFAQVRRTEITGAAGAPVQIESIEAKRERAQLLVDNELARRRAEKGIVAPIDVDSTVSEEPGPPEPPGSLVEALEGGSWQ